MPEIIELYQNTPVNTSINWESEIINVVSAKYITITVYCDQDYETDIQFSVTPDFINIIESEKEGLTGGNSKSYQIPTKAQYVKFIVDNIASTPNHLITQGFFWE